MSELYSDSIFFIDVGKIGPNPYQPRREFEEGPLRDLSESIRQYGVLQPLVVTRVEEETDGGIRVSYELIAGERRLRASRLAGLSQVPAIIRKDQDPMVKLELAIIENLQREDLNSVERARAFQRFIDEFGFSHTDIGKKVGRSRVYVSNTLRILDLPDEILDALSAGKISEGHTRPLLMLRDKVDERNVLFKEIIYKKISVREAERLARLIAKDKVRKKELLPDPEVEEMEGKMQEALGTRVHIDKKENGGQIKIDFFSNEDLHTILDLINAVQSNGKNSMMERYIEKNTPDENDDTPEVMEEGEEDHEKEDLAEDQTKEEQEESEKEIDELYNISNFSL
ncbi:ParB/RepB/Spo0J family partition protein [Candidatus Parcubacteria bacterium]|nr:ParB/RepB/Spo0J family partition protein [Candidatus Parcubacteria bacterium]